MKLFFSLCITLCTSLILAVAQPAFAQAPSAVKGQVLEVLDVESYSYLRLKTKDGEIWAAVMKAPIKKGADVTIENAMMMENFQSKALKKTFQKIIFGTLGSNGPSVGAGAPAAHGPTSTADAGNVKVPKATGPNARTVAEILSKGPALKDKPVLVRGKVVKYSEGVLGKNWIHLQDGTGSAADKTNDVVITTNNQAKVGDIVVVKGLVHTDKDFGAGYFFKVLVEEATLQR